jgi:cardiolipin synthase
MGVESKLGALLDPIGDKVWVIVATLAWWKMGRIPDWLMVMILFRDALIVVGTWVVNRKTGREDFSPSVYGKTSTVIQLTMLAGCFTLDEFWLQWLRLLAAMGTVVSGADYVRRGVAMMQTGQEKS